MQVEASRVVKKPQHTVAAPHKDVIKDLTRRLNNTGLRGSFKGIIAQGGDPSVIYYPDSAHLNLVTAELTRQHPDFAKACGGMLQRREIIVLTSFGQSDVLVGAPTRQPQKMLEQMATAIKTGMIHDYAVMRGWAGAADLLQKVECLASREQLTATVGVFGFAPNV